MANPSSPLSLDTLLSDATLPPALLHHLRAGSPLDDIRLDAHGRWWHNATPITHPRLVALFNRSIDRTPGGTWVLKVGSTTYPIRVDACPLFVTHTRIDGDTLWLSLSDGSCRPVPPCALYAPPSGGLHAALDDHLHARWPLDAYIAFALSFIYQDPSGACVVTIGTQHHTLRDTPNC